MILRKIREGVAWLRERWREPVDPETSDQLREFVSEPYAKPIPAAAATPRLGDPVRMRFDTYPAGDWRQDWVNTPMFFAGMVAQLGREPDVWIASAWPLTSHGDVTTSFSLDDIVLATPRAATIERRVAREEGRT